MYLFITSLMASTILPISSETLLIYYLYEENSTALLLLAAGVGNTIGSIINYYMGKKGVEYLITKEKISRDRLIRSRELFDKYGGYTLLLAWVPIIGDPITLIAGTLRYNIKKFIIIVSISKFSRYLVIIFLTKNLFIFG